MKIITVETLKAFLDELNKKYGTEFYSKTEADNKYQPKGDAYTKAESDERYQQKGESSGGDVDYQELARRIPSWQWKVTLPKSDRQTVTATVGSQTYTSDFYAPQGSNVTFSVKADDGFKAGTLSLESVTLAEDATIMVTAAAEKKLVAGKFTALFNPAEGVMPEPLTVPDCVNVLKIYINPSRPVYAKVVEGMVLEFSDDTMTTARGAKFAVYKAAPRDGDSYVYYAKRDVSEKVWLYLEWSQEINEQTVNVDLTQAGQSRGVRY